MYQSLATIIAMGKAPEPAKAPLKTVYVAEWIKRLGFRIDDVCVAAGIRSRSYISLLKSGKRSNISFGILYKIAEKLRIRHTDLLLPPPDPATPLQNLSRYSPEAIIALSHAPAPAAKRSRAARQK